MALHSAFCMSGMQGFSVFIVWCESCLGVDWHYALFYTLCAKIEANVTSSRGLINYPAHPGSTWSVINKTCSGIFLNMFKARCNQALIWSFSLQNNLFKNTTLWWALTLSDSSCHSRSRFISPGLEIGVELVRVRGLELMTSMSTVRWLFNSR